MSRTERIVLTTRGALLCIPLFAIALTGCSGDNDRTPPTPEERAQEAERKALGTDAEYLPNGNRLITYRNDELGEYSDILQSCDGLDLLEQTDDNGRSGNASSRSVDHPACEDGRLTPEDFKLPG